MNRRTRYDRASDDAAERREIVPLVLAIVALAAAVGIMATSGGCRSSDPAAAKDPFFAPDGGRASLDAFLDAQAARGARDDAMLYPHHFDEAELNGLGREKLDLMLRAPDAALPLVVYLNLRADDDLAGPRREMLFHHLLALGLRDSQFRIESGENPARLHPVAPTLAAQDRQARQGSSSADDGRTADALDASAPSAPLITPWTAPASPAPAR